ncbi:MAG: hypothetical protein JSR79_10595 [Proteobacteria bacterium]|nr:hypothetical protein [Pseudomonadota bacterium]
MATLIRTAEQISALKTENALWAEKKRTDMAKLPSMLRAAVDPTTMPTELQGACQFITD